MDLHDSVLISDGKGNEIVHEFELGVVPRETETNPPTITSVPYGPAYVGEEWSYTVEAEIDGSTEGITLWLVSTEGDVIGQIDPADNTIRWTPDAEGNRTFIVRAQGPDGSYVEQRFTINAVSEPAQVKAPVFTSVPTGPAYAGERYEYQVSALTFDGSTPAFSLDDASIQRGIHIGSYGLLSWIPEAEGEFSVTIYVDDGSGNRVAQTFVLAVAVRQIATVPPTITSKPGGPAYVGKKWDYQLTATAADGGSVTFYLMDSDGNVVREIENGTLFETWNEVGTQSIIVRAVDSNEAWIEQRFSIQVVQHVVETNIPPVIRSVPTEQMRLGDTYQYRINAYDPDGDPLTYTLDAGPQGASISGDGLLSWVPSQTGQYEFTILVWDGVEENAPVAQSFTLTVLAPVKLNTPPQITSVPVGPAMKDRLFEYQATAIDFDGDRITWFLDDLSIPAEARGDITIDPETGLITWTPRVAGTFTFTVIAYDGIDHVEQTVTLPVSNNAPPQITTLPDPLGEVGVEYVSQVEAIDPNGDPISYMLENAPDGLAIGEDGTLTWENPVVGRYVMTIVVTDTEGAVARRQFQLRITDPNAVNNEPTFDNTPPTSIPADYAFNFQFAASDAEGDTITVTRTYDTLNANVKGDFGYGWTLDILQYKMLVDYGYGPTEPNPYQALQSGDVLYFVLPDGSKEGFVFTPQGGNTSGGLGGWLGGGMTGGSYMYAPHFTPMYGNKSELLYDSSRYITPSGYGLGYEDFFSTGEVYSPFNGFYGGVSIKLRNGTVLDFDVNSGQLVTATDKTGNSLNFYDDKIVHSSGKQLTIQRNYQGFISAIIGPDGKKVSYDYDSSGNLIAVTDASGAKTEFTYLDDPKAPEHYLDTIIDPLGRPAAKTEYDEAGRIKKITDADGKTIEYEFDTEGKVQKVTDQLGNTTIIENDDRGNVIREVSPEGDVVLRDYDANGNVLSETQVVTHNGKEIELKTSYSYDSYGNKLTETDARGNVTQYSYDQYGQVVSTTTNGVTTRTNYDPNTGLPTSTTDVNGNTTNYGYDAKGNMTALVNSDGIQLIDAKYNQYGEVTQMTSTNGRTTHMEYDLNGDCIATWYEEDGVKVLDKTIYDESRRVVGRQRIVDGVILWTTSTEYNEAGQVVREIDQNGLETRYTFDVRGQQTEVRSESRSSDGLTVWTVQRTVYDAGGRATYRSSYVEGTATSTIVGSYVEYNGDGRTVRSEQLLGLIIEMGEYGQSYVKTTGTVLASSSTVYNSAGWIVSSVSTNNLETRYVYNVFGETTQTRRELVDGRWMVSETVYDRQGRVIFSTDSHIADSTDPIYGTATIYDDKGRVEKTIRYVGCSVSVDDETGESQVSYYGTALYQTGTEYDSKGRTKSSTDAYGNVTTYEYDHLDRQVAVNQSNGIRSETFYNAEGQVEKTVSNVKINSDGTYDYSDSITTVNTYNMYGQVVKTVSDGRIVEYEYDDLGRQVATIDHPTVINGIEVRHRTESVYNELGQLVISRTNVKQFTDGTIDRSEAQEQQYVYDARGNVVKTIFADGTTISAAYNDQGQKISETNQLGQTRHFEYDLKGRLIAVVLPVVEDPETGKMVSPRYEYQYDDFGRQTLVRDPNGFETRFEYDAYGNQVARTLPLGFGEDGIQGTADDSVLPEGDFTERSVYDDNGRLFMQISFEGVITTFSYDSRGRLNQKFFWQDLTAYAEGTGAPKEVWTYTYDDQGRVTCIDQNGRKTETTYDSFGRTTSIKTPQGAVSYEYDKFGRQIRVSSDKGDDVGYGYDIFGRLATVTDNTTGKVTTYEYDLVGNLARTTTDTGEVLLVTTYEYDNMNRLRKQSNFVDKNANGVMDSGEGVSQFAYTLDAQGRKTRANETFWIDGQEKKNQIDWTYDNAGRLVQEAFDHFDDELDQTLNFQYDLTGNRLLQTVDKGNDGTIDEVFAYLYDANDRLIDEFFDGQNDGVFEKVTNYGYDHTQQTSKAVYQEGTLVSDSIFEYDVQGRMSVVTITTYNEDGSVARQERTTYKYGADGIRVSALHEIDADGDGEFESKKLTEYLNDSKSITGYSQVLRQTDYDAEGNVEQTISNIIGHGRISQKTVKNGVESELWFSFDGHGSTRVLLDVAGAVAQLFAYDAYGQAIGFNPADALTEFLFSGEQFDAKIGQQYLRARYYDPATGRFNRNDPFFGNLTDPQSLHNYLYAHSDPVNATTLSFLDYFST